MIENLRSWIPAALAIRLETLLMVVVAMLLAELLFRVGDRLLRRTAVGSPLAVSVTKAVRQPARVVLPLLALNLVWQAAPEPLPILLPLQHICGMLLIAAVTWLLARGVIGFGQAVIEANPLTLVDNLNARRIHTQARVLTRTVVGVVVLVGCGLMLLTLPGVRRIGAGLLASAGVMGIIAGYAARPLLGNLIAGLQIGLSQPIRLHDVVIVEGEWGVIEEITGAYVVVRIWDQRRLVVPLQYWIEKPFQNWTRSTTELIGTVFLWVDYTMPLAPLREALQCACASSPDWDGRLALLQVTEAGERAMRLRALVTAADGPRVWDLRCHVREQLVEFMQRKYPQHLPRLRAEAAVDSPPPRADIPSAEPAALDVPPH